MNDAWDPLARPGPLDSRGFEKWFWDHVTAFQRYRPDLPQAAAHLLPYDQRRRVMDAYIAACCMAKLENASGMQRSDAADHGSRVKGRTRIARYRRGATEAAEDIDTSTIESLPAEAAIE
jgi:hypothetical protein